MRRTTEPRGSQRKRIAGQDHAGRALQRRFRARLQLQSGTRGRVRATRYRSTFGGDDRRDKARWESWMMRQSSTASSACPSMEPQISSTSIDGNLSLRYHATDQCQMNFSFRLLLNFVILV